jgi:membrane protein insertase Oxa1/YidC/SpoIIIJ
LLYSFVSKPETLQTSFFGWFDLVATGSYVIAVVAGLTTYFQTLTMPSMVDEDKGETKDKKDSSDFTKQFSQMLGKQMKGFMPIMSFIIVLQLPAAVGVYWITRNIFTTIQNYLVKPAKEEVKVEVKK